MNHCKSNWKCFAVVLEVYLSAFIDRLSLKKLSIEHSTTCDSRNSSNYIIENVMSFTVTIITIMDGCLTHATFVKFYLYIFIWLCRSLMEQCLEQAFQWHEMYCHDLEEQQSGQNWGEYVVLLSKSYLSQKYYLFGLMFKTYSWFNIIEIIRGILLTMLSCLVLMTYSISHNI